MNRKNVTYRIVNGMIEEAVDGVRSHLLPVSWGREHLAWLEDEAADFARLAASLRAALAEIDGRKPTGDAG